MKLIPTASQTVGPFFHFGLERPAWADLTGGGKAIGDRIRIEGQVRDGDGAPVQDALLEIWQANAAGKYDHPEDEQEKPVDPGFRGFGRCATDAQGRYAFTTVRPGRVPGRGNTLQAPHVNMTIFARGLLKHLVTRVYFADRSAANESDPVLATIDDPVARRTLLASAGATEGGVTTYRFDIILQGDGETVFFEA
ncbi:MAG: protocatechuate 3,4-dioxygenase subunit alpha [Alphaproteobacteria bacterium]|nr:protocatechuate 3,4-dioxygenase subunit alpha [Alphaproteobacteria bacterium]